MFATASPVSIVPLPASTTLQAGLERLELLRLGFCHRLEDELVAEPFKGSMWHGAFGACLHDLAPRTYEVLMHAEQQQRSWALRPPLLQDTRIPAGSELRGELVLTGDAVAHADACLAALDEMGRRGLGPRRAPAVLESTCVGPRVTAWDVFHRSSIVATQSCAAALDLHLRSPLRTRERGSPLRSPPSFAQLLKRSIARLVTLLPDTGQGLFAPGEHAALMQTGEHVELLDHRIETVRWQRRSSRQQRTMPFDGLLGHLSFAPAAMAAYPWMALAEWWQLGSKTTFGLGIIEAVIRSNERWKTCPRNSSSRTTEAPSPGPCATDCGPARSR